jgi:hypothetical protein
MCAPTEAGSTAGVAARALRQRGSLNVTASEKENKPREDFPDGRKRRAKARHTVTSCGSITEAARIARTSQ